MKELYLELPQEKKGLLVSNPSDLLSHILINAEDSKIIFVDDGSDDSTWEIINKESSDNRFISGIKLSRNFGHHNALLAGMIETDFDVLVSIDADLQDDVSAIEEMLLEYHEGKEIVYGVRSDRSVDGFLKRSSALIFYKLLFVL